MRLLSILLLCLLAGCATQKVEPLKPVEAGQAASPAVLMPPKPPAIIYSIQQSVAAKPLVFFGPPAPTPFRAVFTEPINCAVYNLTFFESDNGGPWHAVAQVPPPSGAWVCYNYSGTNASALFTAKCNQPPIGQ